MDMHTHSQRHDHGDQTDAPKPAHQPDDDGADPALQDPVCGMPVTEASTHKAEHAGRPYWFCSAGCRTKFVTNPQRYPEPVTSDWSPWVTGSFLSSCEPSRRCSLNS